MKMKVKKNLKKIMKVKLKPTFLVQKQDIVFGEVDR